jgi:imidazolonepropionase-like amidohydrolase
MKRINYILFLTNLFWAFTSFSGLYAQSFTLVGGTAHIGDGTIIENATIVVKDGKITAIGNNITPPTDSKIIETKGKQIYPALILPNTTLGLRDVDAVRATLDFNEIGLFNPNSRALIAFNTDSDILPTVRSNGVLLAQATPRGGMISGTSSIMKLNGWNWEDAVYAADDGVHMNWIKEFYATGWWAEPGGYKKNEKKSEQIETIKQFFQEAKSYLATSQKTPNLRFEAMKGIFDGKKRLYVHADRAKEIIESIQVLKELGVKNIVIVGAEDAWAITDFLKKQEIPVILNRLHRLPATADEPADLPYRSAALLQQAGILVALDYEGDMEAMGSRNLPFIAGTAATYLSNKEQALSMVTLNTAKILGIEDKTGSLTVGKDANIVISTGDLLDMRTNQVTQAFLQGQEVDLQNKHKELYEKFSKKYD